MRRLPDRLYEIDLLRIIAALSVVLYHYTFSGYLGGHSPVEYPALSPITRYGYLGVDMFFVISASWCCSPHGAASRRTS